MARSRSRPATIRFVSTMAGAMAAPRSPPAAASLIPPRSRLDGRQRRFRRSRDHLPARREPRSVAGTVPRPLGGVPGNLAAHVGAGGGAQRHDAVLVAIRGDRRALVIDDLAL